MAGDRCEGDPSPEEIRRRCWAIQSGWTARQERRRMVCKPRRLTAPVVSTRGAPEPPVEVEFG